MEVLTTIAAVIGFVAMILLLLTILAIIATFSPGSALVCTGLGYLFWRITIKARKPL